MIAAANQIIEDYQAQGFDLTLRQLYYQFVSRGLIPNRQTEYKRLGSIISKGRMAGLVDWDAIVDRTRSVRGNTHWGGPGEILQSASDTYCIDKWKKQEYRVEVWIEKDALVGVIADICEELDVKYFSCRGYASQSSLWRAATRLNPDEYTGQHPVIIHLGDHDPSGVDMTRDIEDRLFGFNGPENVWVDRIALNMDQIERYDPPPNPAKLSDSRAGSYIQKYGRESWELDALNPATLAELVREKVCSYRNDDLWEAAVQEEEKGRGELKGLAENFRQRERVG